MILSCVSYSGLLNFNEPHRDRLLMANGKEEEEQWDDRRDDVVIEESPDVEKTAEIEDHIIENLPPALHKGNNVRYSGLTMFRVMSPTK